jgi:hypothetical protein
MKVTWELEANIYSILKKTKRKHQNSCPIPRHIYWGNKDYVLTKTLDQQNFKLYFLLFQSKNSFNQHDINQKIYD